MLLFYEPNQAIYLLTQLLWGSSFLAFFHISLYTTTTTIKYNESNNFTRYF